MTGKEIVQALRCCAKGLGHDDACENCKAGETQNRREYIEFAAANAIERLTAENTALREGASLGKAKRPQKKAYEKSIEFLRALTDGQSDEIKSLKRELEWKDMVITLAQRKQAEAEAERDALREKVPQWVSVKDRLPDCAVPVLVTYIGYDGNRHGDDVATRLDDWWLWWDGDLRSSDERVTVKITHWMPLPEAPEEGDKA